MMRRSPCSSQKKDYGRDKEERLFHITLALNVDSPQYTG
jgi:hypothetical protein